MSNNDPFYLQRFLDAQEKTYDRALAELQTCHKRSHWMWYVFPQLESLGFSRTARYYGLSGLDEANAYLNHPVLGARLRECTRSALTCRDSTLHRIFGHPDDLKFCSCMTLFERADPAETLFKTAIEGLCSGERCSKTLGLLSEELHQRDPG